MSKDIDIPELGEDPTPSINERRLDYKPWAYTPKENFWKDKPLGRTLSLRNKTGKTIAGVLTGGLAIFTGIDLRPVTETLTGTNNMELLTDLGLLELLIGILTIIVSAGVAWAKSYWKLPAAFISKIQLFIEVLSEELVEATRKESEGGSKITRNERREIAYNTFKDVFGSAPQELKEIK